MRHKIILSKGKSELERLRYDWNGEQRGCYRGGKAFEATRSDHPKAQTHKPHHPHIIASKECKLSRVIS